VCSSRLRLALFECKPPHQRGVVRPKAPRGGEEHEGLQGRSRDNPSAEAALIWILALVRAVSSNRTVACSQRSWRQGRRQKGLGAGHGQKMRSASIPWRGRRDQAINPYCPVAAGRGDDEAIDTGRLHTMEDTPT